MNITMMMLTTMMMITVMIMIAMMMIAMMMMTMTVVVLVEVVVVLDEIDEEETYSWSFLSRFSRSSSLSWWTLKQTENPILALLLHHYQANYSLQTMKQCLLSLRIYSEDEKTTESERSALLQHVATKVF